MKMSLLLQSELVANSMYNDDEINLPSYRIDRMFKQRRNTEQRLDDEISNLLSSDDSHSEDDSILDAGNSDEEEVDVGEVAHEEEGEVDDLL